jgi:hypothetical protein
MTNLPAHSVVAYNSLVAANAALPTPVADEKIEKIGALLNAPNVNRREMQEASFALSRIISEKFYPSNYSAFHIH